MGNNSDESAIIDRFKRGEKAAFEELVLKYQDRIYNLCRHMLGNGSDAEDAAQDTFIKAYQNLKNFRPEASFYTWVYRIAVNTCLDYKKRPFWESLFTKSEREPYVDEPVSDWASPEKLYESKQLGLALHNSITKLPSKLRTAIILNEIEGLSYDEIADILEISLGTVKSRISRAREVLKTQLKIFMEQK
ncbi:MAG: sigma-70 family RNA polymerase sigma factor [Thermodesulfovibrionales bacterium]